MQQYSKAEQAARRTSSTVGTIKRAIEDQACLSGTYADYKVRFAPHVLGHDDRGNQVVIAFEYGGGDWMLFAVHRLRRVERNLDRWRSGSLGSRPQIRQIEASIDNT